MMFHPKHVLIKYEFQKHHIPLYRTATGQRTFAYRGTSIWNNLYNDIKQCFSLQFFKQAIKGQLTEQAFNVIVNSFIHYL